MNLTEFQHKIAITDKPVVVDFWATWCMPCKMTKPTLEKLVSEYAGKVEFIPVDADESREILEQFQILGIPTVITFRNGKEVGRVTGAQNEAGYRLMFDALIEGKRIKAPIAPFVRLLRLSAGFLLGGIGFSTNNWLLLGMGGLIVFFGVYDRCPIWAALTGMIRKG